MPTIPSHTRVRPIVAMDSSRDGKWLAVARTGEVALYKMPEQGRGLPDRPERLVGKFPGKVTALHFTADGSSLITASGVAGLGGVAAIWNLADGALIREFAGHRDTLYDAELSPDGKLLATCGYDKEIEVWETATGKRLRVLEGHTGAIYDVAFSPDSRFLVSASADDTCKVWRVADGQRMDTLPQPLKAEYTCSFSPDGQTIVAAGADNNIRVWQFVSRDKPEINPMVIARFAHEAPIIRLAFTPDGSKLVSLAEDRTVKVWRTKTTVNFSSGKISPTCPRQLHSAATAQFWSGAWTARFRATRCRRKHRLPSPRPRRKRRSLRRTNQASSARSRSTSRTTLPPRRRAATASSSDHRDNLERGTRTRGRRSLSI